MNKILIVIQKERKYFGNFNGTSDGKNMPLMWMESSSPFSDKVVNFKIVSGADHTVILVSEKSLFWLMVKLWI